MSSDRTPLPSLPSELRRRRLGLAAVAALGLVTIAASCVQQAKGPRAAAVRTLDLGADDGGTKPSSPFAVVFGGPRDAVVDPSEVSIVWNRPMRPLDLAGQESAPPATLTMGDGKTPRGAWRWMGTSALVFAPDPALPRATDFTVTVPAGTKAMDGSALAEPYSFTFSTPRPKLVRTSPYDHADHVKTDAKFDLRFNQPVEPKEVERAAKLLIGSDRKEVPFHARWPKPDIKTLVELVPASPLPPASSVELALDASLRGTEGPLPLGLAHTVDVSTYGPLHVDKVDCWRETPHGKCDRNSVRLELSNSVPCKDLKAHLSISPATSLHWTCEENEQSSSISIPAVLAAARSYVLTISAGLKDEYGQSLARTASLPFETDDEWPSTMIGLQGSIFEAGGAPGVAAAGRSRIVPIGSINTSSYELLTAPLDESGVTRYLTRERAGSRQDWSDASAFPKAKIEQVLPKAADNVRAVKEVSLDAVLKEQKGRGAALIGIRAEEHPRSVSEDVRVVSVTDLGITAKMSRFGSVVWVSRLSDGKPVAGATVAIRKGDGEEVFRTKTDDGGIAVISEKQYNPVTGDSDVDHTALLFARAGDDWAYRRVDDMVGYTDLAKLAPIGMLFTERGVYKPGETVKVKGLFRQPRPRSTETPAGRDVHLTAFDGSGEKVFDASTKLDAFGGFAMEVPYPATAHMGSAELRAEVASDEKEKDLPDPTSPQNDRWGGGGGRETATAGLLLAAYKPAEFKVAVDPDKPAYVRGDQASFSVEGDYLFGAPMSGGGVHFTVTRAPGHFTPPGAEKLVVDDSIFEWDQPSASLRAGEILSGRGSLSGKGTLSRKTALTMPGQGGTELVTFEAEVEDTTRQSLAGRASVIVHPGEFYVAMKSAEDMFVSVGTKLHPEVLAIEPSGKKRAGVPVHVELVRRTWHSVLEATGESSGHYQSRTIDTVIASCDVTTTDALAGCDLPVTEAGFLLLHAKAKDGRKNPVAASSGLYALGEGTDVGWLMSDASTVDLVPDKKSYEVGQTAKVLVKSPFHEADALVTVERAGIFRQERMPLTGATPVLSIPITDEMRPNAYVSVQLVRGRTQAAPPKGPDAAGPAYRTGVVSLSVNPEARRLAVKLTPSKTDYRPGAEADADVYVSDREGHPVKSSVTFYAVDEGVLMLTGYRTPDPIPVFTAARPLAVYTVESRTDLARLLIHANDGAGLDKGASGGGGDAPSVRQDFRATAYFEPSLVTGADGKAHVHFKLPDGLTTYRFMAVVAAEDDRFGFGEAQVVTSRQLMARPAMPRFLRAGDAIDAGFVVTSKGLPATQVEVGIVATGVTVSGETKRMVALPANGSVEVRWPIAAKSPGKAMFTFSAKAGQASDEVRIERDVEIPLVPEAVALYGETSAGVDERLGDLTAMRDDVGGLDLRLSSTALVGLDEGVDALIHYPYGCTEQLTSRLVPLIPLVALANDYHVALPPNLDQVIDETIAKILKNQRDDGSFGWWIDSPAGDPWLTGYALWGLTVASQHGHHVPEEALDHATRSVRDSLAMWDRSKYTRVYAAFLVDVLAMAGTPDPGYADQLYEKRAELPLYARAELAHAMTLAKMDRGEIKELLRDVDNHLRVTPTGATVTENAGDEYATIMDSEAHTTALVLRALVTMDPKHPLAARIAKGLLGMRKGGTWRTTQETAWSLIALDDYRHAQETKDPDFEAQVLLNDAPIFSAPFHQRTVHAASSTLPAAKLFEAHAGGSVLGFQVAGSGTLFYEARLRYSKKEMPADGLDRGFFVRKIVRSLRPEELRAALSTLPDATSTSASGSDMVLVDLIVVTPDPREQVVIDDPLPAGLEPVDTNLATTARTLDVAGMGGAGDQADEQGDDPDGDARANGLATNDSWYHREVRDDRVITFVEHMAAGMYHYRYLARATTFGTFVVPPTRAECMYEPETFGRTAGGTFEVKARP